jgi:hypothetical protein
MIELYRRLLETLSSNKVKKLKISKAVRYKKNEGKKHLRNTFVLPYYTSGKISGISIDHLTDYL